MALIHLGQGTDLLGENFPLFCFNNDDSFGAEQFKSRNPGQSRKRQSLIIGRIKKDQIKRTTFHRERQRCGEFAAQNLGAIAHAAPLEISRNNFDRFRVRIDEKGAFRPAAQGFEGQGTGPGEEVENLAAIQGPQATGEDAEESFTYPIRCRSDPCSGEFDQSLASRSPTNDPQ